MQDVDIKQLEEQLAAAKAKYNECCQAAMEAEKGPIPTRKERSGHPDAGVTPQVVSHCFLRYLFKSSWKGSDLAGIMQDNIA